GVSLVRNSQLLYALALDLKYTHGHIIFKQEKVKPALQEEKYLYNKGGAVLSPINSHKYVVNHNGFYFSGLICNEFLNIRDRANLRGLIDALIVIEWNKDINTYNALVESAANDLHCCVIQVNNRLYGDTRLRIPYKEDYMKDAVRVRGGELDYFVISTLPVIALREFQRDYRSGDKPFKPVPTGYEMSPERRNN
ncbi:MAG: Reverse transcriptase, partial [Bacteroidota bacterium]